MIYVLLVGTYYLKTYMFVVNQFYSAENDEGKYIFLLFYVKGIVLFKVLCESNFFY